MLVSCEMQTVSFKLWTRVAVSISYDGNYHTISGTNIYIYKVRIKSKVEQSREWSSALTYMPV